MKYSLRSRITLATVVAVTLALAAPGHIRGAETLTMFPALGSAQYATVADPAGTLALAADGNFYGLYDDASGFQLTQAGVLTVLPSIGTFVDGPDGNSYGVGVANTSIGGYNVLRRSPDGTVTTVHSFYGNAVPQSQSALFQATDGNFYGTTYEGGDQNRGSVFRLTPDGTRTVLHSFSGDGGEYPVANVIQAADGNFYGTARLGGSSDVGTAYRLTPDGTYTVLHTFNKTDGSQPYAELLQATDGNFYGTTAAGGTGFNGVGGGTVFRMTPDGSLTTLHNFTDDNDGYEPSGALIEGGDGNFYGTTLQGGPAISLDPNEYSFGTVFQMTPDGALTTLRAFDRLDGGSPNATLARAADGAIYGTTSGLGDGDIDEEDSSGRPVTGTIFRLSAADPAAVPTLTAAVAFPKAAATDGEFIPTTGGIVLTLSSPATRAIKVKYTVSGTAVSGYDYKALPGKVKFKPGETGAVISIVANFGAGRSSARNIKLKLNPGSTYDLRTTGPLKIKVEPSR